MKLKSIYDLVVDHPLFADLEKEEIELVSGCGENLLLAPNTPLAKEGEAADYFYLIRSGAIGIHKYIEHKGPITLQTLTDNDVFGWSWIFPPYRWSCDAEALSQTRCIRFDGACLRTKCETNTKLGYDLMRKFAAVMSARVDANRLQLLDIYHHEGE